MNKNNKKTVLFNLYLSGACLFRVILYFLFLIPSCFSSPLPGDFNDNRESLSEIEMVNMARAANNLHLLQYSPMLTQASTRHSDYMAYNSTCGHDESNALPSFSGTTPQERAMYSMYSSNASMENVSCGEKKSWQGSVDDLMGAIYHRLAFLKYDINEIGFARSAGYSNEKPNYKFTYMMGNSSLRQLCDMGEKAENNILPVSRPAGNYVYQFCRLADISVKDDLYFKAKSALSKESSSIVVYPWPGQNDVTPAFLDNEVPDPTPSLGLSGIPVSVQFNHSHYKKVTVISFSLKDLSGNEVRVWPLNWKNDPHKKLSGYEYAWFPVRPLKRAQAYTAEIIYDADEKEYRYKWSFQTRRQTDGTVLSIGDYGETLIAAEGQRVTIQWNGTNTEAISGVTCKCRGCKPKIEDFDTMSVFNHAGNISCEIKDSLNKKISFDLTSL